jgi:hypothetical protein
VGDEGKARDGGQHGGGISETIARVLPPPPTEALSSRLEHPSNKTLVVPYPKALPPTLLDSPLKKPLDMTSDRTTKKEGM